MEINTTGDIQVDVWTSKLPPDLILEKRIVDFLFENLDEYGDPAEHIRKCLEYAVSDAPGKGGFIVTAIRNERDILGAVIVNETGMGAYIPENILVYIAVDKNARGLGLGKKLMSKALENAKGDVALHVEPENPAFHLYKKLGFTQKYLEMRYKKGQ